MQTKQALSVLGTLLFLFGIFGYIFPTWESVMFQNNENLLHTVAGLFALLAAQFAPPKRRLAFLVFMLLLLALSIYGFSLKQPTDISFIPAFQLDEVDNYVHAAFGLAFGWFWLQARGITRS